MSSPLTTTAEGGSSKDQKREETLRRSLRECTTRRLTHYFPCDLREQQSAPTLSSRVQWHNEPVDTENIISDDHDLQHIDEAAGQTLPSPVLSEMDELTPSDCEHSQAVSRPSTGASTHIRSSYTGRASPFDDGGSYRSYSDSSDTERRQPNFPGNRDIIGGSCPSISPSPPTRVGELVAPPSARELSKIWKPTYSPGSSSLDLRLFRDQIEPSRDDRNKRIGLWRSDSAPNVHRSGPPSLARYAANGPSRGRNDSRSTTHSPSLTTSSTPPSPLIHLPPIQLHPSLYPSSHPPRIDRMPGVYQWRVGQQVAPASIKRLSPYDRDSADEYESHSLSGSPYTLTRNLPSLTQSYPPGHPLQLASQPPSVPRNKNAWKDHAVVVPGANDQTEFRCVWRVGNAGTEADHCGYTAKRHLVKRHIETRHLQFKDHICEHCGKAFPQRVSLMIHVNRHTGLKPHKCRYDCDKSFSDPARRHKHMVEVHGYNPQGPRKRHRTTDSYHTNSHFETLAPWAAKTDKAHGSATAAAKAGNAE